jgi:hypothetical protein
MISQDVTLEVYGMCALTITRYYVLETAIF